MSSTATPLGIRRLGRAALFAALTAVAAQIAVPLPLTNVPFTLQVFAVLLSGLLLGRADAFWAQIAYLALGLVGVPVFAGFTAGLGALLGPTGGYLWSFPAAAWLVGLLTERMAGSTRLRWKIALAAALPGVIVIYAGGVIGLQQYLALDLRTAVAQGAAPFIGFDVVKAALAAGVAVRVRPAISR